MSTPNKERLRLWVADLRSGGFEQARGTLRSEEGAYCCLGVACEVFARESGTPTRWEMRPEFYDEDDGEADNLLHFVVAGEANSGLMPWLVADWFGVTNNPAIGPNGEVCGDLNDTFQWSFQKIAAAVEGKFHLNDTADALD